MDNLKYLYSINFSVHLQAIYIKYLGSSCTHGYMTFPQHIYSLTDRICHLISHRHIPLEQEVYYTDIAAYGIHFLTLHYIPVFSKPYLHILKLMNQTYQYYLFYNFHQQLLYKFFQEKPFITPLFP